MAAENLDAGQGGGVHACSLGLVPSQEEALREEEGIDECC